jgi:hypothetical protein
MSYRKLGADVSNNQIFPAWKILTWNKFAKVFNTQLNNPNVAAPEKLPIAELIA